MGARRAWICPGVLALSWLSPVAADDPVSAANQLWARGQNAMRQGQPDEAIRWYQQSLAADPTFQRNHLSLAAAYLEKQDEPSACTHLGRYLESYPTQAVVRGRYAELLQRLHRLPEARVQFERVIIEAQEQDGPARQNLVKLHSRLMEIGEETHDEYAEHLHRGIGLFLLACQRSALGDADQELPAEGILCKAAAELTLARGQRPDEARPCWYLYEVWSQLGQRQPALCRLREAEETAPFSYLTAAERRRLCLAQDLYRTELAVVASKK